MANDFHDDSHGWTHLFDGVLLKAVEGSMVAVLEFAAFFLELRLDHLRPAREPLVSNLDLIEDHGDV